MALNGWQVLASKQTLADQATRPGQVILAKRMSSNPLPAGIPKDEWVTAWLGDGDKEWCWGHYFFTEKEAFTDYEMRACRGY